MIHPLYIPLDESMSRPRIRALRGLRRFSPDWTSGEDLVLACDIDDDTTQRNTFWCAVTRAIKLWQVERRQIKHADFRGGKSRYPYYRITPAGIAELRTVAERADIGRAA